MRKPYYRKDRSAWYVVLNGRRIKLSEDKAEAFTKWSAMQTPRNMDVSAAVQKFLDRPRRVSTQAFYVHHLNRFLVKVKMLRVGDLKTHNLTDLLDQYKGNYRHNLCRCVKTCFKWLYESEHIARNPFALVKTPPATARGDEAYIAPEVWTRIRSGLDGDLLDILTILRETGCRPKEARQIEARHLQGQCCILDKDESKGGLTQRVIHLSNNALSILRRLALKRPTGRLLRNGDRRWSAQVLANRCERLGFTAYQLRHTWATDAILRGVDLVTIATLMGHSDLKMLSTCYSHVQKRSAHLHEALQRVTA